MRKMILGLWAMGMTLWLPTNFPAQTQTTAAASPHLPRGTATDVSSTEIQALVEKTAADRISDQAIRVVSIHGEYNVGVGVVHRAKTSGAQAGGGIEHSQITEIYHVMEGNATLVTGGSMEHTSEFPADHPVVTVLNGPSTRGGPIQNGVSRKVGAGHPIRRTGSVRLPPIRLFIWWCASIPTRFCPRAICPSRGRTACVVFPAGYWPHWSCWGRCLALADTTFLAT